MSLPVTALPVIKELITATANYQMCKERERAQRMKIEAQLEACLETINKDHKSFLRAMDDNKQFISRAYDAAESLLVNPAIAMNPNLLQAVLMFLQNAHAEHSIKFVAAVNAHASTPLRIG